LRITFLRQSGPICQRSIRHRFLGLGLELPFLHLWFEHRGLIHLRQPKYCLNKKCRIPPLILIIHDSAISIRLPIQLSGEVPCYYSIKKTNRPTNKERNNIKNNKVYYSHPLWVKIVVSESVVSESVVSESVVLDSVVSNYSVVSDSVVSEFFPSLPEIGEWYLKETTNDLLTNLAGLSRPIASSSEVAAITLKVHSNISI